MRRGRQKDRQTDRQEGREDERTLVSHPVAAAAAAAPKKGAAEQQQHNHHRLELCENKSRADRSNFCDVCFKSNPLIPFVLFYYVSIFVEESERAAGRHSIDGFLPRQMSG